MTTMIPWDIKKVEATHLQEAAEPAVLLLAQPVPAAMRAEQKIDLSTD
jgi:hypothetical protein